MDEWRLHGFVSKASPYQPITAAPVHPGSVPGYITRPTEHHTCSTARRVESVVILLEDECAVLHSHHAVLS
jgi:hypothetical protein